MAVPKDKTKIKKENPDKVTRKTVKEIKPDPETDRITLADRKELIVITRDDIEFGETIQKEYIKQKELDLKHYNMAKPSELETVTKKKWQFDSNLGIARSVADSYQATLLATSWNPGSIHFVANTSSALDNRNNQEKFTKWGMGEQEANAAPEMDGFVHNRIVVGSSFLKIYRKRSFEWIDKRIPVKGRDGNTKKYRIETVKEEFEKGVIENIPDIDDILMPAYGKNIQELPFFVHILHLDGEKVLACLDEKKFVPSDVETYKKKLYNHAFAAKERTLGVEKLKENDITVDTMQDADIRRLTIDLYEWYGMHTKNGKTEKHRVIVDLVNDEVLSIKPLRKVTRTGKIPFVGGSLYKTPGQIRGESLMQILAPLANAINNIYAQKSDFQYVENCPFGFFNPEEGYTQQAYDLEPMMMYPTPGKPQDNIWFPNLGRSMAWADNDIQMLLQMIERLTGAASYFMTRDNQSSTLGQDQLIDRNSETRFSLWVNRVQKDIAEAITMWFQLYQDYPPKGLAERVINEDGTKIFPNLSVHTLRGQSTVQLSPDVVAGSKQFEKQMKLWAFEAAQQTPWLNPQLNPSGNWELTTDTFKVMLNLSDGDIKRYFGDKPKQQFDEAALEAEWYRFMDGEDFEPPEGETAFAIQHLKGHQKQKKEKLHLLDKEYRPNFESHLFKTEINVMKLMQNVQRDQTADRLASNMILRGPQPGAGGPQPGAGGPQPVPGAGGPQPVPGAGGPQPVPGAGGPQPAIPLAGGGQ